MRAGLSGVALGLTLVAAAPAMADHAPRVALLSGGDDASLAGAVTQELEARGFDVTRKARHADLVIEMRVHSVDGRESVIGRDMKRRKLSRWFDSRDASCGRTAEARYDEVKVAVELHYAVDLVVRDGSGRRLDRDSVREQARETYRAVENVEVVNGCGRVMPGAVRDRELERLQDKSHDAAQDARRRVEQEAARVLVRKALSEVDLAALAPRPEVASLSAQPVKQPPAYSIAPGMPIAGLNGQVVGRMPAIPPRK